MFLKEGFFSSRVVEAFSFQEYCTGFFPDPSQEELDHNGSYLRVRWRSPSLSGEIGGRETVKGPKLKQSHLEQGVL